jgi:accessory gene regulator B
MGLIDRWIFQIADYSIKNNPQSPSKEVIVFVFRLLANILLSFTITLLICSLLGHFKQALVVVAATVLLKMFSGSLHFKSVTLCILYSSVVMIALTYLEFTDKRFMYSLSVLTIAFIYWYAPKNITVFFKFKPEQIQRTKWVAIALILSNLLFLQLTLVTVTFAFHALSITPMFEKLFILLERRIKE